jgi:hypothetical protein
MPPSMSADFHYKAGIGLARFGRFGRARDLLNAGLKLAETHQLNAWYFRLDAALAGLSDCEAREPEAAVPVDEPSKESVVQEVAVGLREYALQTS